MYEAGEAEDREEMGLQVNEMCRLLLVFRVDVRVNGVGNMQRRSVYSPVKARACTNTAAVFVVKSCSYCE